MSLAFVILYEVYHNADTLSQFRKSKVWHRIKGMFDVHPGSVSTPYEDTFLLVNGLNIFVFEPETKTFYKHPSSLKEWRFHAGVTFVYGLTALSWCTNYTPPNT